MENLRQTTIDTYNDSATELAEYFKSIGPRVADIDLAFKLAGDVRDPRVLEIGCGDGRDAKEIVGRSGWYHGIDISVELIKLARKQVPEGQFSVADAATHEYPEDLDVVFAFASLLHLNRDEIRTVMNKARNALRPGGIFYISLKERPKYTSELKQDRFGTRLFYFYNASLIRELAGQRFEVADSDRKTIGQTNWFEIALRKI